MMKKMISVVLTGILMLASVTALAAPVTATQEDIAITLDVFSVSVVLTTAERAGDVTAQIRSKNTQDLTVYGVDEAKAVEKEGVYTYSFHFKMPNAAPTDTYYVKLGNGVLPVSKEFPFVNANDKLAFYNALNAAPVTSTDADVKTISDLLLDETCKSTYDLSVYRGLSGEVRLLVDEKIAALDLAASDLESLAIVEQNFTAVMDEILALASIADMNESNAHNVILASVEKGILDGTFYSMHQDGVVRYPIDGATVVKYKTAEMEITLDEDALSSAFDRMMMLAYVEKMDAASVEDAFDYYLAKKTFTVNEEDYKAVQRAKETNALFKALKQENLSDIDDFTNDVNSICKDLLKDEEETNKRPATGGGGGGGGGTRPGTNTGVSGDAGNREPVQTDTQAFSDMENHWAKEAVVYLSSKGVVAGRGDGKFYPNDTVTREEFVKMIVTAFSLTEESAVCDFADVATNRWSYTFIASGVRAGVINGVSDTEFNPTGCLTRQDMAVIVHRVNLLRGGKPTKNAVTFADKDQIASYAMEAVATLTATGVINGMGDNTFAPNANVTRAQAAKVIYEVMKLQGGVN